MALSNWLGALGQGFGGYATDQKNAIDRARQQLLDQQNTQLHQSQMANFAAEAAKRQADAAKEAQALQGNQKAFGLIQTIAPQHPLAQGEFNPGIDYINIANDIAKQQTAPAKKPSMRYDPDRGVMVNEEDSTFKPIPGLPPKPTPTKEMTPYEKASLSLAQARLKMEQDAAAARSGGSGGQQAQQARMLAAVSEARLADERMRTFEDQLLGGGTSISPLQQAGGTLTTNLSGAHTPLGAGTQALSEYFLNKNSPEYAQYLRDAATVGRAEQMMSPRGGNETMVRANALLSRAGTGAMKNTIDASRMARQALFGTSGGIEQTLSPQQSEKLRTGVQTIKQGGTGNINLGANDLQSKYDAAAAHLTAQGKTPEEIKQTIGERP